MNRRDGIPVQDHPGSDHRWGRMRSPRMRRGLARLARASECTKEPSFPVPVTKVPAGKPSGIERRPERDMGVMAPQETQDVPSSGFVIGHLDTGRATEQRIARLVGPALVVSALVLCAACHGPSAAAAPAPAGPIDPASAQPAPPRQILNTLPAHPHTFELSREDCAVPIREQPHDETACTFAVRLLEGAKVLDRIVLAQVGCGPATPTAIDRTLGADRDAKAFGTSDEHCEVNVAVRTVDLAPQVMALLLTQRRL